MPCEAHCVLICYPRSPRTGDSYYGEVWMQPAWPTAPRQRHAELPNPARPGLDVTGARIVKQLLFDRLHLLIAEDALRRPLEAGRVDERQSYATRSAAEKAPSSRVRASHEQYVRAL